MRVKKNASIVLLIKKDGMVSLIGKHCQEPDCKLRPNYNYKDKLCFS